jgi:nucleotide-binding universal stress UspA family protein
MADAEGSGRAGPGRFGGPVVVGVRPRQDPRVWACAADLAAALGVRLVFAYADPSVYPESDGAGAVRLLPIDPDAGGSDSAAVAEALTARLRTELAQVPVDWEFRRLWGSPAQALHRAAEELDASLIVVGTREGGRAHHLEERLAGSVADRLVHSQQRPILVVR